jgi:hypothetical protein
MFSVLGGIFSQNRCVSFIEYGKCKDVLLYIYRQVQDDSLTVDCFKENYRIIPFNNHRIFEKSAAEVIEYFYSDKNENLYCRFKHQEDPVLFE